jgi:photosynthetic reaction center cytochrome c subunit
LKWPSFRLTRGNARGSGVNDVRSICAAVALLIAPGFASAQGVSLASEGKTAEQVYKNITALKGTPANELNQAMHLMKGALGVDCLYCHIEREWDKDVKAKPIARQMITMMMDINTRQFGGRPVVTCYTCHNGRPVPLDKPVFPVFEPKVAVTPTLPTVDSILSKYVEGLGGAAAIQRVTSRTITGTQYIPTGPGGTVPTPAVMERYLKAPNLSLTVYKTATYSISQGFDGTTAWSQDQNGRVSDAIALDTARAKRGADVQEPLNLRKQYAQMTVEGIDTVNGRETYVVVGIPQGDTPERLYFDARTGMLLRKVTVLPTPIGQSPFQTDYDDYRDTDSGVKVPFLIQMNPANPRTELAPSATLRITKVDDTTAIDASRFARPATPAR